MVERALGDWPLPAWMPAAKPDAQATPATPLVATVRDLPALRIDAPGSGRFEAVLGHRLAIRCDHPDYMALRLANHILGSGFGSRLVRAVRVERGLTYAIRSQLAKPALDFDGHWQVEVSLSPEHLDAGLAATREAIARFVDTGVSEDELAVRKGEIVGAFQISLATLHGLAETLLFGAERGLGAGYPQVFVEQAAAVTAAQLARTIAEHLRPDELRIAIAGPFDAV
jgi:zinc protease